jgi:DNA-binding PadR family transcriptional regulator
VRAEASSRELFVLGLLSARPAHGYELDRLLRLTDAATWLELSGKHVYYVLRKLEGAGVLTSSREPGGRGPDRKVYSLTPAGRQLLRDALLAETTIERGSDALATAAISLLPAVGVLTPSEKTSVLVRRRDEVARRLASPRNDPAMRAEVERWVGRYGRALWEKGVSGLAAEATWLEALIAEVGSVGWDGMAFPSVDEALGD